MKIFKLLCIVLLCLSCNQGNNVYDEKDYFLVKLDSFENKVYSKILVNKFDTSRKMVLLYWDNGNVMSRGCFKGKLRDGINEHFYIYGNLQTSELYSNGKKEGLQRTYYTNGKLKSAENYTEGKLVLGENLDSLGNTVK